jgi:hypothetical protein
MDEPNCILLTDTERQVILDLGQKKQALAAQARACDLAANTLLSAIVAARAEDKNANYRLAEDGSALIKTLIKEPVQEA